MKRSFLLAAALCSILIPRTGLQAESAAPSPTISVAGTAEVRITPDEVNLKLAIETRDAKLDEAVKQNETRTAVVLKFLKEAAIDAKDVQTDFVEIQPQYNTDRHAQQIVPQYYLVRRNLGVRLRKVTQFDEVLAGVLRSGVNYVLGIDFRTTELRKHRDAARQQAIRAAKEKALALAKELDVKVGKAQTINEQTHGGWWGWSGRSSDPFANAMVQNVSQSGPAGEAGEGNLAVGMISVTATVNVTFALE
jgi:uncharacterized protein